MFKQQLELSIYFIGFTPFLSQKIFWQTKFLQRNYFLKKINHWSFHSGSAGTNLASIHEDAGSIPGLSQWVKDLALPYGVAMSCGVGHR